MSRRRQLDFCGGECGCQHGCILEDRAEFAAEDRYQEPAADTLDNYYEQRMP